MASFVSSSASRLEARESRKHGVEAQRQVISDLRKSAELVGRLYPVLVDKHGKVIDGYHRLKADPDWPKMKVQTVVSEELGLLVRLISNFCRRDICSAEKSELLAKLGRLYLDQGVHQSELAERISMKTGMSYRWVMKYIPDGFKVRPGLGGPKKLEELDISRVARLTTDEYTLFLEPEKRVANLSNYSNTKFATIIVEKQFYLKLKEAAAELGVDADVIINNALILTLQKVEKLAKERMSSLKVCTPN